MQRLAVFEQHAVAMTGKVVEQCAVRDCDAVREPGSSRWTLEKTDIVRRDVGEFGLRCIVLGESLPDYAFAALAFGCGACQRCQLGRVKQHLGIGAAHLRGDLIDVTVLAASWWAEAAAPAMRRHRSCRRTAR